MLTRHWIISSLDIGSSTTNAIILEVDRQDNFVLVGHGQCQTQGLVHDMVQDIGALSRVIGESVSQAEEMAGVSASGVNISIGGEHVRVLNCRGGIPLPKARTKHRQHIVDNRDIKKAIENAGSVPVPPGLRVLHVLPLNFLIDGRKVESPLGLNGVRLDVDVMIIGAKQSVLNAIAQAAEQADVRVRNFCYRPLATSRAVLTPDERLEGACVIDIGGGHTDVAIFQNGVMRHASTLTLGSDSITSDTVAMLEIPGGEAEKIKREYGHCCASLVDEHEFQVSGHGKNGCLWRTFRRSELVDSIIQPRAEEILEEALAVINGFEENGILPTSAVLTGGGAMLNGIQNLAATIFPFPIKKSAGLSIGMEAGEAMIWPDTSACFATAMGLALLDMEQRRMQRQELKDHVVGRLYQKVIRGLHEIM
ncbi:MAG: cell division protein FtsA [Proteobacteria bacterium]|nr:cell division protein FtsA [Pseudomonadota bacterium]MBU1688638.1 cell division protein FtsA [Pseudomonadota bacterium]